MVQNDCHKPNTVLLAASARTHPTTWRTLQEVFIGRNRIVVLNHDPGDMNEHINPLARPSQSSSDLQ